MQELLQKQLSHGKILYALLLKLNEMVGVDKMNNDSCLPLGEKIKHIRAIKGISQENMARAIKSNQSHVHRIEQGQVECSADMLAAIKKFLEIEKAPLLKDELSIYRHRIWVWDNLLNNNRLAEAADIQAELSSILDLPFEHDLCLLFTMIKVKRLIIERNIHGAEEAVNEVESLTDNASNEALYMFHRNKGILSSLRGDIVTGLRHYLNAHDLTGDNLNQDAAVLTADIGAQYLRLGRPYNAMIYLERAYKESYGNNANNVRAKISNALAITYTCLGEYDKAKKIFDESIGQAKSVNDNVQIGSILSSIGLHKIKSGSYKDGIGLCDQALHYMQSSDFLNNVYVGNKGFSNNPHTTIVLFNKGLGLLKMKEYAKCQEVLAQGKALAEGDKKASIMFDTLMHFTTLNENESQKYIENVAIPFFRAGDGFDKFMILDLCKDLEAHYKKKRAKTKALAIAAIARDIYEEMFIGEIEI